MIHRLAVRLAEQVVILIHSFICCLRSIPLALFSPRLEPVSYTQLDVYKRQILPSMEDMHYRVRKRIVGNIAGCLLYTSPSGLRQLLEGAGHEQNAGL